MQLNNLLATEESSGSEQGEAVARDEDDNGKCNFNTDWIKIIPFVLKDCSAREVWKFQFSPYKDLFCYTLFLSITALSTKEDKRSSNSVFTLSMSLLQQRSFDKMCQCAQRFYFTKLEVIELIYTFVFRLSHEWLSWRKQSKAFTGKGNLEEIK